MLKRHVENVDLSWRSLKITDLETGNKLSGCCLTVTIEIYIPRIFNFSL